MGKSWILLILMFVSGSVFALQSQSTTEQTDPPVIDDAPLRELGDRYYNSIKLLQNRFRIDYKVDEITMVFFRSFGSRPVVLIRPDGSKVFLHQSDGYKIDWYDAPTFDMIKIFDPMPGPWQAVGQILPGSRVMVVSDIQLETQPLPSIIFSGEILKQTAYLTNGGKPIDYNEFRDVVSLSMDFYSTNNPNYANFGAASEEIATFEDNGKGMDEAPLDGTFTGQFNLRIAPGEWKPTFTVKTPMFTRERIADNVILLENPISIDVALDEGNESGFHILNVDADREKVDIRSLLIDGKVRFPNGDVQNFSITEVSNDVRSHDIVNFEYGVFRVKLTAYGNTVEGRDFILDVPEYTFVFEEPIVETSIQELDALPADALSAEALAKQELELLNAAPIEEEEGMDNGTLIMLIVAVNVICIVGGGAVWFFLLREKPPETAQATEEVSFMEKAKKILLSNPFAKDKSKKNNEEQQRDPGVIDLSMPE